MPVKNILTATKKSKKKIFLRVYYDTKKNLVKNCIYANIIMGSRQKEAMKCHFQK